MGQFNLLNSNSNIIFEIDFARSKINMNKTLVICLAVLVLAAVAIAAPFNAVGPFYNGNIAKAPYFAIAEHTWPGLVKNLHLGRLIVKYRATKKGPSTSKQFNFYNHRNEVSSKFSDKIKFKHYL